MSINFKELKEKFPIEQVVGMLGLHLNREGEYLRGECPACEGSADRGLSVQTKWGTFKCFTSHYTGSAIDLVAHVKGCSLTQAARFITDYEAPKEEVKPTTDKGFPPEVCKLTGIAYAKAKDLPEYTEVTWKKPALIPIRDKSGNIIGNVIVHSALLPKEWRIS